MSTNEVIKSKRKKLKISGRMRDIRNKLLASIHEVGLELKCIWLKCFQNISKTEQHSIIQNFKCLQ